MAIGLWPVSLPDHSSLRVTAHGTQLRYPGDPILGKEKACHTSFQKKIVVLVDLLCDSSLRKHDSQNNITISSNLFVTDTLTL